MTMTIKFTYLPLQPVTFHTLLIVPYSLLFTATRPGSCINTVHKMARFSWEYCDSISHSDCLCLGRPLAHNDSLDTCTGQYD